MSLIFDENVDETVEEPIIKLSCFRYQACNAAGRSGGVAIRLAVELR
jgi:hypothetical protein